MSRSHGLIALPAFVRLPLVAAVLGVLGYSQVSPGASGGSGGDDAIWSEFGLVERSAAKLGTAGITLYRMKDLTGAVAAWEWQRGPASRPCNLEAFCSADGTKSVVASANYLAVVEGRVSKANLDSFLIALPKRRETSLPAILSCVPRKDLVPNTARYVLGPESLKSFAPALAGLKPGFEQGAEAQVADYKAAGGALLHLAVFYYPTPEMARLHLAQFKALPGVQAKRSTVLVGMVYGADSGPQADALLKQIAYEAKVTWNDIPPPSPIKPLYQLLWNIIYLSGVLVALCLLSGLIYAGIRLYRRRFGTLEDEEAMTTLHLSGR